MATVESGGAHISYARTGAGPAVLMIQGVGLEGRAWAPQVAALASGFTVVTFDNRGIGSSTAGDGALTIERMADDAIAIMDAEAIERFHVIGHSMGGAVAQQLALVAPARVLSLSLLCTFARGRDAVQLDRGMMWTGLRTRVGTRRSRRAAFLEMIVPTAAYVGGEAASIQARLTALFGRDLADQPTIAMKQLKALSRYDARDRLAGLRGVPTLVVSGELDRIARPSSGRTLARAIHDARYEEIAGAGHAFPAYRPEWINDRLIRHLGDAEQALQDQGAPS